MEQTFAAVLSGLRKEREMSLRELGQRTTFSHVYLWQIERGEKRPTSRVAEACDRELRAGGELLALVAGPATTLSFEPSAPTGACSLPDAADPTGTGGGWPFGAAEASTTSERQESLAGSLWEVRGRFERLYQHAGGVATRPRLNEFLRSRAMPSLDGGEGHPETVAAVAALQALAAACAHDCLDRSAAEPHARFALVLAQRSGRIPIVGYALSVRARFELWTGQPDAAEDHIERALAMRPHFDETLVADLCCLRAETHVRRSEIAAARQALLEAARVTGGPTEAGGVAEANPETRYLVPGTLEVRRAEVLRRAGDLDEALDHARASLVLVVDAPPRVRVHASTVYARVLADRGELAQAARAGVQALESTLRMESRLLPRRLAAVGRACAEVDPWLQRRAEQLLRWLA